MKNRLLSICLLSIISINLLAQEADTLKSPKEEVDGSLRIREILKAYFSQKIAFVTTEISSTLVGEDAPIFAIEPGKHLLNLKMTFYSNDNKPLTIGDNYLNDAILKPRLVQAWN